MPKKTKRQLAQLVRAQTAQIDAMEEQGTADAGRIARLEAALADIQAANKAREEAITAERAENGHARADGLDAQLIWERAYRADAEATVKAIRDAIPGDAWDCEAPDDVAAAVRVLASRWERETRDTNGGPHE